MIALSTGVLTWQHVVGHTSVTAKSMHLAPIVLLTSISTCTGAVIFFIIMSGLAAVRVLSLYRSIPQGEVDIESEESKAEEGPEKNSSPKRDDIMTTSMVWTNVYGLGIAMFFLSYVCTMASTLATFSFSVGMAFVCIMDAVQERYTSSSAWPPGSKYERFRSLLHASCLTFTIASMCTVGAHVSSMNVNRIGNILPEDVFLGVVGPCLTPFLLKGVRGHRGGLVSTIEISLPFTMFICVTFMCTALAMGMRPYESQEEIGRNLAAATTLMPLAVGASAYYVLHCTTRRRSLYVFSTFMMVLMGRELTMNRGSVVVISAFVVQLFGFLMSMAASSLGAVEWSADLLGF